MPQFEVTSSGPDRVRVEWSDEDADYYFIAKVAGDAVVEITSGFRAFPTVFRNVRNPARGYGRGTQYFSANDEAYAPIVKAAEQAIADGKLATAAMDARKAEREAHAAAIIVDKAVAVRRVLGELRLPTFPEVSDATLAALYDSIQNAAV